MPADVEYVVEGCDDLRAGAWSAEGMVEVGSEVADGVRTVTVRDGVAAGAAVQRFLRLRVVLR